MATVFEAGTASALAVGKGVFTTGNPVPRNVQFDIYFDCLGYDRDGNQNQGVGFAFASASGSKSFVDFGSTATAFASASGTLILGNVFAVVRITNIPSKYLNFLFARHLL